MNNSFLKKINLFTNMYNTQNTVFVQFCGTNPKNCIPLFLKKQKDVVFQYGKNMPVPITNFHVTFEGIEATLLFKGIKHRTFIVWESVSAIYGEDEKGYVFTDTENKESKNMGDNVINFADAVKKLKNKKK